MKRALTIFGSLLLLLAVVPTWGTQDYFGIKRVRESGFGFDLYRLRIVESGHPGQDDWQELGRLTDGEPFGVSFVLLLLGAGALVGSRFVPSKPREYDGRRGPLAQSVRAGHS